MSALTRNPGTTIERCRAAEKTFSNSHNEDAAQSIDSRNSTQEDNINVDYRDLTHRKTTGHQRNHLKAGDRAGNPEGKEVPTSELRNPTLFA